MTLQDLDRELRALGAARMTLTRAGSAQRWHALVEVPAWGSVSANGETVAEAVVDVLDIAKAPPRRPL